MTDARALLEREDELDALGGWLTAVERSGAGRAVFVAGEAGVGKTTLVRRFCGGVPTARVLWGSCDPLAIPAPLGPVVEVAGNLGGATAAPLATAAQPYEVAQALLDDLAGERLAVMVMEDLHWADEGTLDVLAYVFRRIERVPVLAICTYREDEVEAAEPLQRALGRLATTPAVERLQLHPLTLDAVRTLAEPSGRDARSVFAATRGNPFFVTELLAGPSGEIPGTVRDAVLARAAALDDEARSLLDAVAVIPPVAELWLLERIAPAGLEGLRRCLHAGMLERRGDAAAFRHELARLVLEAELDPSTAVELHRRVLTVLEGTGAEPARLVHHADAAGDRPALLRHAVAAGERSSAMGAHREAAAQYARAVAAGEGLADAERADLLSRCAFEHYLTDRIDEAIRLQRDAVERLRATGDRLGEGDALRRLSRFLWFGGRGQEAMVTATAAVAVLERLPPGAELARAYSAIAQLNMLAHDTAAAISWGLRALDLAQRLGVPEVEVHALANIGTAEMMTGRERDGRAKLETSLARARVHGYDDDVGRAYANLASLAVERREAALADRYLTDGIAYCDEHDLSSYGLYLRAWQARRQLDSGRWQTAGELTHAVLAEHDASPPTRIVAGVTAGLLAARTGDDGRARSLLNEALRLAEPTGELQRLAPVAAARAEAAWLRRDSAALDAETATIAVMAADHAQPWPLGELSVWRRRSGLDAPEGEAAAPFAAELAGDAQQAAMLWTDLGCPYEAAVALAGSAGEADLRRALSELQRLRAGPAARLVARRLRELGVRDIPRGPHRATADNPAALTAREMEVLRLLADGLRNVEIAQRLVVSPRTVDHHVSAILAKLGARTRGEAAAAALRLGLTQAP